MNTGDSIKSASVKLDFDARGVATMTLCRTRYHNAFDSEMIAAMQQAVDECTAKSDLRVFVLQSEGENFSAGADLRWMKQAALYSYEENKRDAEKLSQLMQSLDQLSVPTIVKVQGPAYGGALGLICACDIAIASDTAKFCLSEVKLGLVPAVISPYVVAAMGKRQAQRFFITAEAFDSNTAHQIGIIHEVCPLYALNELCELLVNKVLDNGPVAVATAKRIIKTLHNREIAEVIPDMVDIIAKLRTSSEGQEGLAAFLEKRKPSWADDSQELNPKEPRPKEPQPKEPVPKNTTP